MAGQVEDIEKLPFLSRLVRWHMNTGLRGQTGFTHILADRFDALRFVPITIGEEVVYMDMRKTESHDWLRHSPHLESPIEKAEQALMRRIVRSGDTVFDIGANIGLHTSVLASLVGPSGRVIAFEPNPELVPCLKRTAARLPAVTVFQVALSDTSEPATLYIRPSDHSLSRLAKWTGDEDDGVRTAQCECQRLEDLAKAHNLGQPAFLKCDVEGAELYVFRGATAILDREDAPAILLEVNDHNASGFGLRYNNALDYLLSLKKPGFSWFELTDSGHLVTSEVLNPVQSNIMVIPAARMRESLERGWYSPRA